MKLNTIIRHWPVEQNYNTRYRRVVRAAKKIPLIQGDEINANSEVTAEEIRRIIKVMPKSTPGYEHAESFLLTHPEGFPEKQWEEHCKERQFEKTEVYRAIQEAFKEHDKFISRNNSEIAELIRENQEMKDEIRDMNARIAKLEQRKPR